MTIKTQTFNAADYLDNEETIAEYLNLALEDQNPEMLLLAIGNIARARGMAQVAQTLAWARKVSVKDSAMQPNHAMTPYSKSCEHLV